MTSRIIGSDTYTLTYDVENRLKEVVKKNSGLVGSFGYDGDGKMVTATVGVTTTFYVGVCFEKVGAITHTYYYHAGKRIAVRKGTALYWLLTDHLGSTAITAYFGGGKHAETRYPACLLPTACWCFGSALDSHCDAVNPRIAPSYIGQAARSPL